MAAFGDGSRKEVTSETGSDNYVCAKCKTTLIAPIWQNYCSHRFCDTCTEHYRQRRDLCPTCKEWGETSEVPSEIMFFRDSSFERLVRSLKAKCGFVPSCGWIGEFSQLQEHASHCVNRKTACRYCGSLVLHRKIRDHVTFECRQRRVYLQSRPIKIPEFPDHDRSGSRARGQVVTPKQKDDQRNAEKRGLLILKGFVCKKLESERPLVTDEGALPESRSFLETSPGAPQLVQLKTRLRSDQEKLERCLGTLEAPTVVAGCKALLREVEDQIRRIERKERERERSEEREKMAAKDSKAIEGKLWNKGMAHKIKMDEVQCEEKNWKEIESQEEVESGIEKHMETEEEKEQETPPSERSVQMPSGEYIFIYIDHKGRETKQQLAAYTVAKVIQAEEEITSNPCKMAEEEQTIDMDSKPKVAKMKEEAFGEGKVKMDVLPESNSSVPNNLLVQDLNGTSGAWLDNSTVQPENTESLEILPYTGMALALHRVKNLKKNKLHRGRSNEDSIVSEKVSQSAETECYGSQACMKRVVALEDQVAEMTKQNEKLWAFIAASGICWKE